MALPADWNANDQYRMATIDRAVIDILATIRERVVKAKGIKAGFNALGLASRWPTGTGEYVHQEKDAETRQELTDAATLIDYLCAKLLNDGTTTSLTDAQAATIMARYAR